MVKTCGKCDYYRRDKTAGMLGVGICSNPASSLFDNYTYSFSTYAECPMWDVI